MTFKDHFSGHASAYARYRPDYPAELFDYLATLTPRHEVALDCATGSGQAAIGLARHFDLRDRERRQRAQLQNAQPHPQVAYLGNLAEQPGAAGMQSIDLVVAAQAAHWFDHARFHPEMRRVLRPDGALAIWTYGLAYVDAADRCRRPIFLRATSSAPYWPPERRHVESAYRDLPFPWQRSRACRSSSCELELGSGRLRGLRRHLVGGAAVYKSDRRRSAAGACVQKCSAAGTRRRRTVSDLAVAPARRAALGDLAGSPGLHRRQGISTS